MHLVVVPLFFGGGWVAGWHGGFGWVVVFIFATCEKNTLEHIKLRMLKMLYGFSVRFISILYVLFIYIRLCQPFHQMRLATPSLFSVCGGEFSHRCLYDVRWVRFQFQIHIYLVVIVAAEE